MSSQLWKNTLGWGFALWFIGYALGIMLFAILPPALIGWAILLGRVHRAPRRLRWAQIAPSAAPQVMQTCA